MKNAQGYSLEDKKTIARKLKTYKATHGISDEKLGKLTGLKQYAGYVLREKFEVKSGKTVTPIKDGYFQLIESFLGENELVVETKNYQLTFDTLTDAKDEQEFRIVHGSKGAGKTFTIQQFVKSEPENTYVITCAGDMRIRELIMSIGYAVGVDTGGSSMDVRKAIKAKLENQADPVIIVDEAENLLPKHYASIKALCDDLEDMAGIVLVGSHKKGKTYLDWLLDMSARNRDCFPQLMSRIGVDPTGLVEMSLKDCAAMCKHYNIEDLSIQKQLFTDCKGDYRVLDKLIKRIVRKRQVLS